MIPQDGWSSRLMASVTPSKAVRTVSEREPIFT